METWRKELRGRTDSKLSDLKIKICLRVKVMGPILNTGKWQVCGRPHQAAQKPSEEIPFPISRVPGKGQGQRCWGQMYKGERQVKVGKMM